MILDRKKMLIEEFIAKGKLGDFRQPVSRLISKIWDTPLCTISCCDVCERSLNRYQDGEGSFIQIAFKNRQGEPIHIIWDILHEYGHHLSGPPNGEPLWNREVAAWEYAAEELKQYPELLKHKDAFLAYQEFCLETYRKAGTYTG